MEFKTIQQDFGVTVDLGNYMFTYSDKTHSMTDLTDGASKKVRITRKIDGLHEIFSTDIANFVNTNGDAVATDFASLKVYLETSAGGDVVAMKYRAHSPSGVYKDGEVIDVDSRFYKAIGDIDGSVTPVPFSPVNWLEVSASQLPDYILGAEVDSGQVIADADRIVHNDSSIMRQTSFTRVWAWIVTKASGAVSTILTSDLSTGKALASNAQGKIIASAISDTELSYLDNVSSNIQTQINGKKPNYTNMYQMQSYGTINGDNGSRVSGTGFSVTRAGEGHYRVYNLPYMDHNTAMIQLQSVSDPDNMYCLYDVGTNEFWVRFYDAPTMAQQDINFKFIISRLV